MANKMLTENFSVSEVTFSSTAKKRGISNDIGEAELRNALSLAENVLQPLRDLAKVSIGVNSWYRSKELNTVLGGSKTSDHLTGRAADIVSGDGNNARLFCLLAEHFNFDQLIWEEGTDEQPAWIHVSFRSLSENRNQILRYRNKRYENFVYK